MIVLQIGIIVFLVFILAIVYQDEFKKKKLERKSAKLNRFWKRGKDRRKTVRINTEIDVFYEVDSGRKLHKRNATMSRNISLGGINLALNEKLSPGTTLQLQLDIPERAKPIHTQGKIVWIREISERFSRDKQQRYFAAGIKFIQMKPEDEVVLRSFIDKKIRNK